MVAVMCGMDGYGGGGDGGCCVGNASGDSCGAWW